MKKRVLSMFMALALCLTLLPAPARAAEADAPEGGAAQVTTAGGTEQVYGSFNDAWSAAIESEGSTLKLLSDVELSKEVGQDGLPVSEGSFTLDLNNKTLQGAIWYQLLEVSGTANITIKNGSLVNTQTGPAATATSTNLVALKISGGTVALDNVNLTSGINSEGKHSSALYITGGSLTVTGSTFTGEVGVFCENSGTRPALSIADATLNNGIFYWVAAAQASDTAGLEAIFADGSMLFDRDEKYIDLTKTDYWPSEGAETVFFYPEKCIVKPHTHNIVNGQCECGAQFAASVTQNGAVTYYEDFAKALDAWLENGGTLKLYGDYTATDGTWSIGSGSHTINLNGHMMSVKGDGAFFKPTNNMHLTVTDGTERGQIENILLDGSQRGSFTLESGYVGNLKMTGGAVVTLKDGSVDELDVQNCSANTNLSIQGGSIGKLNITDWADGMHVSATGGSLGAYTLPSDKILADVLDHQYYATGTSLDRQVDTAQPTEKFVIKKAPYDFGSTSKTAEVPMNGSIPFRVDSPSENVGVYDVKWYRRTNRGAEHMTENRVADVNVGDTLDVFCVITGLDRPGGEMQWQVAVKGYKLKTLPPSLENAEIRFAAGGQERTFWPDPDNHSVGKTEILSSLGHYTVTLGGKTLTEGTDYRVISGNVATGIGTYDLKITGIAPNYSGTKTAQWTVVPYPLGAFKISPTEKQYDGTVALPDGAFRGNFDPRSPYLSDITLQEGTDYVVTDARFDTPDASNENKVYRYTVELKNPNYVFANGTKVQTWVYGVNINATIEITKADAPAAQEGALEVINNHADTYAVDLSALLPKLESPRTYGEIEYSQPTVQLASGYYTDGNAKVENGKLILTIDKNPVTTIGSIGTVTVQVTTTNYKPVTLTVNLRAVNKQRLGMFVSVATDPIVYGMTLGDIKLSAEATVGKDNQVIPGTIAWEDPLTTVPAAGRATYRWTFTPDDTMHYLTASNTITFLVDKATPTGAPTYAAITTGGKTLADAPLTPNASWPSGTVQWVDKDGKPLPASTQVQANTEYTWSFTPADAANYNGATGSVTLYAVSSGGGGGSSSASKTSTTTNADGSVTKTETKSDGTVVETTTGKDGSTVKTTTNPNGSSVTENKAADGSTGTVKTDKNGNTEAETKVSAQAVEDAKKSGEAVKAPVEVEASRDSSTAPTVKVELPKGAGETKVEIPVTNVKPGTVAVLVHPDGTEEIVKNSLPTEDGIQLTINGGATVKIVDNSKGFIDTQDHWAKDAIDFVSARGLVSGMSGTTYAPDASTTRAQLWTILARQNDADLTGGSIWYEKAQNWAKEKGISDGTNPNGTINRAQMVTMLWRAAGSPAAQSGTAFQDVAAGSYYAQAVAWAIENGITTGVGGGRFDPNSTCTRAQIATFLWRAMAE